MVDNKKLLKNEISSFPNIYNPKYWSDNAEIFKHTLFYKDLTFFMHNLYSKIELAKLDFPECINCDFYTGDMNGDGHCTLDNKVDYVCCPKDEWFDKYFGKKGTLNGIFIMRE